MNWEAEMNEVVTCKLCGGPALYGEMIWLDGRCMCPKCYQKIKAKEKAEE
jgi:formylmethanofuran dehydrogenase subunit E